MKSSMVLTKKTAVATSGKSKGKSLFRGMRKKTCREMDLTRRCRIEELEKREVLSADPLSIGVVYVEQGATAEADGDRFYVAWVGGETSSQTTLDQVTIDLNKDGTSSTDGEAYFHTVKEANDLYSASQFKIIENLTSNDVNVTGYSVENHGQTLVINLSGFHAGDSFVFSIDLDEFPSADNATSSDSALVEGGEMGGSIVRGIGGSFVKGTFVSEHYETENWTGMFIDDFDNEDPGRFEELTSVYTAETLPYDTTFDIEGISSAGVYDQIELISKPITISGYVYADYDRDCHYDREVGDQDEPLHGVNVYLYSDDTLLATTQTSEDGYYSFTSNGELKLLPGEYTVICESNVVNEGIQYYDYCCSPGTYAYKVDPVHIVVTDELQGGEESVENNFAKVRPGSIDGYVFEDLNNKNNKETGESGIAGVTVSLYKLIDNQYVKVLESSTDQNGYYHFEIKGQWVDDPRTAGEKIRLNTHETYQVVEGDIPPEYYDGKDYIGTLLGSSDPHGTNEVKNQFSDIYIGYNQHGVNYNFGELKLGSLQGYVFEDRNDDGIMADTVKYGKEAGISNVLITLYQNDGNGNWIALRTTRTDENGAYSFEELPIVYDYAIAETQPVDYDNGKLQEGSLHSNISEDRFSNITVGWDEHGYHFNFGELKLGSIEGNVYEDRNDDGIMADTVEYGKEAGIAGVTVYLYYWENDKYVSAGASTKTDADGHYSFEKLDINKQYAVSETQPDAYTDGKEHIGTLGGETTNDYISAIPVGWDEHGEEYDFGELKLGSLSGYVYEDDNDNGIREEGEKGIENVTIMLYVKDENGEWTKINQTQTLADGSYFFDHLDINQQYAIREIQPTDYNDGQDTIGSLGGDVEGNDYMVNISVKWDEHGVEYDFGELVPPEPVPVPDPDPPTPGGGGSAPPPITVNYPTKYIGSGYNPFNYIFKQPTPSMSTVNFFGGGGLPASYSWHLSVVDGGYPRSIEAMGTTVGFRSYLNSNNSYQNVSWSGEALDRGQWLIRGNDGSVISRYVFGFDNAIPVVGDWNGDGTDSLGLFVEGQWFMDRNGDGVWDMNDLWAELGTKTDQPVIGDWDGDGKSDIGIFGPQWAGDPLAVSTEPGLPADSNLFVNVSRPTNVPPEFSGATFGHRTMKHRNSGEVRLDLIDHVFEYGNEGDRAITGDWNGDGVTKIGVYRQGKWYLDINGNGKWDDSDVMAEFGGKDALPVVGDFNHDGIDEIGTFENGRWSLDTTGDYQPDVYFTFGQAGDMPVAGDFNGDGQVQFGVYRPNVNGSVSPSTQTQNSTVTAPVAQLPSANMVR